MTINRNLVRVYKPLGQPGFLGPGHTARPVISGSFDQSDPFIMLMDDILIKNDEKPVGGPHPHAGFETATLILEGELGADTHKMKAGDFQLMTAGSGIIHTETIEKKTQMRILQLWLNLPSRNRWTTPRLQDLPAEHVPNKSENGVAIKLHSGSFAGLFSPLKNYVPVIVADIQIEKGCTTIQNIPANFNTLLYVLKGSVHVGTEEKVLYQDQVGWLDLFSEDAPSELKLAAGDVSTQLVLYSGKPLGEKIVAHGPFIADQLEDIARLYQEYRQGRMQHISEVPEEQRLIW